VNIETTIQTHLYDFSLVAGSQEIEVAGKEELAHLSDRVVLVVQEQGKGMQKILLRPVVMVKLDALAAFCMF